MVSCRRRVQSEVVTTAPAPTLVDTTLTASTAGRASPRSSRIVGLDIARGIAVIGMIIAHVGLISRDLSTWEGWLYFANGRSSILFATLAGVSLGILMGGRNRYTGVKALQARSRVFARAAMLLAIGGALIVLGTPILIILAYYAVWFVIALPFVNWGARRLIVVGTIVATVGAAAYLYLLDLMRRLSFGTGADDPNGLVPEVLIGSFPR